MSPTSRATWLKPIARAFRLSGMAAPSGMSLFPSAQRRFVARELFLVDLEDARLAAAAAAVAGPGRERRDGRGVVVGKRVNHVHTIEPRAAARRPRGSISRRRAP